MTQTKTKQKCSYLLPLLIRYYLINECIKEVLSQPIAPTFSATMTDQLDGVIIQYQQNSQGPLNVLIVANNPYSPSDENCQAITSEYYINCYIDYPQFLSSGVYYFILKLPANRTFGAVGTNFINLREELYFYINYGVSSNGGSNMLINPPANKLLPQITLSYTQFYIQICTDTIIRIKNQYVNGNTPLQINSWNLEQIVNQNDPPHFSQVSFLLSQQAGKSYLEFPPLTLKGNYVYQFSVIFQNIMGTVNKQYFQLSGLQSDILFASFVESQSLVNIDFTQDWKFQVFYNGTTCSKSVYTNSQITVSLYSTTKVLSQTTRVLLLYTVKTLTNANIQNLNFSIPSQYLSSSSTYLIDLTVEFSNVAYNQTITISTADPILISQMSVSSPTVIQNNSPLTIAILEMSQGFNDSDSFKIFFSDSDQIKNFFPSPTYNDKANPPQFNYYWFCYNMDTYTLQTFTSSSLSLDLSGSMLALNTINVCSFYITAQNSLQSTSICSIILITADVTPSINFKLNYITSYGLTQNGYASPFTITNGYAALGILQNYYNTNITNVLYLSNFRLQKVDYVQSVNELRVFIGNLSPNNVNAPFIFSLLLNDRQMSSFNFVNVNNINNNGYTISVDTNNLEAIVGTLKLSLPMQFVDIYIYTDQNQMNSDLYWKMYTYGFHLSLYVPTCLQNPDFTQTCIVELRLPNNPNSANPNQIFLVILLNQYLALFTLQITVFESSSLQNFSSLNSYVQTLYNNGGGVSNSFKTQLGYNQYLNYLLQSQLNYIQQKQCSDTCSANGTCQLVDEIPLKKSKILSCVCQPNYYSYDCSATIQDINQLLSKTSQVPSIFLMQSLQASLQFINLVYASKLTSWLNNIVPLITNYKEENLLIRADALTLYTITIDFQAALQNAVVYFDYLISYSYLAPTYPDFVKVLFNSVFNTQLYQMGAPLLYLTQNSFCGYVINVPQQMNYLSRFATANQMIVNLYCSSSPVLQQVPIPYDSSQNIGQKPIYDLYFLFLHLVYIWQYPNQYNPGFYASISDVSPTLLQNITLYFDYTTFYQINNMGQTKISSQKLVCAFTNGQLCDRSYVVQNGENLIKCVCLITTNYPLIALIYDDSNFLKSDNGNSTNPNNNNGNSTNPNNNNGNSTNPNNNNNSTSDGIHYSSSKNEVLAYQQIIIMCYLVVVSLIFLFCSITGYSNDKKQEKEKGNDQKIDNIFDVSANKIQHEQKNKELKSIPKSYCQNIFNNHSIGFIHITYQQNISRFARYLTAFYIYLSLPAYSGIVAKYQLEESKGISIIIIILILLPVALRVGEVILNFIFYFSNKKIKISEIKNIFVNVLILLYISGLYGSLVYIYFVLWTDANSSYLNDWIIYLAILIGLHAIVYEIISIVFSYLKKRSQLKIDNLEIIKARQQINKKSSQDHLPNARNSKILDQAQQNNHQVIIEQESQINLRRIQSQQLFQYNEQQPEKQELKNKNISANQSFQENQFNLRKAYSQRQIEQEGQQQNQQYLKHIQEEQLNKEQKQEEQQKKEKIQKERQLQQPFEENVVQQIQIKKKEINLEAVHIDGFDENGNLNVPSEYNIFSRLSTQQNFE